MNNLQKKVTRLLSVIALVASPVAFASEYVSDKKVFHGSHCHALHGSDASRLTHNVDWLSNNSTSSIWVTCPLTRDSTEITLSPPDVKIRVYRPAGNTALDCQFYARTTSGNEWLSSGSATTNWSFINLSLSGTGDSATYAVRCLLPGGARIQKIVLQE